MRRRVALLLSLGLLAGCGGADTTERAAAPAATPTPAPATPRHGRELVYLSRNVESGIPEDVYVYADGAVRYRFLLHTKLTSRDRTTTLPPVSMRRLRALLTATRLRGAQRLGAVPPRGRFWYLLRIDGHSITTADGHLSPGVKPLITRLGRLEDRMLARGED